jgi:Tfp pilus assembly protein PilF
MASVLRFSSRVLLGICCLLLLERGGSAQTQTGSPSNRPPIEATHIQTRLVVYIRDANGGPISSLTLVTLTRMTNQYWQQMTAQGGQASFDNVASGRYSIQVIAGGYEKAIEDVEIVGGGGGEIAYVTMRPETSGSPTLVVAGPPVLAPKAQKEVEKALEAIRAGNLADARKHLDTAYRLASSHPDVNFLFGVYSSEVNDWPSAKYYFEKAVTAYPRHLFAQISLSDALLRENKPKEAIPHLKEALEIDPNSWRAHAFLADADLRLDLLEDAVREAERAIDLGHERAARVRPTLASALVAQGKPDRAIQILEPYLREHASDADAQKQLASLRASAAARAIPNSAPSLASSLTAASVASLTPTADLSVPVTTLSLVTNWLPPNVDQKVPPVESGVPCALNEVVQHAGERVEEFVRNMDHFTATESLLHESVNAWGTAATHETRKFNYVVSIEEIRPGRLTVYEYRDGSHSYEKFPGGMATVGLPSLVLIFHPFNAVNYDMECEGLAHWNGGLAWQIHFRQRRDKPARDRLYRFGGASAPGYPVALKGRAWIAADTYQIVRIETDIVAPLPEIRLLADHVSVEYRAVHFQKQDVDMWLPSAAEVFYDIKGRRIHRRHSFSDYMLFSVDERQRISAPKIDQAPSTGSASESTRPDTN